MEGCPALGCTDGERRETRWWVVVRRVRLVAIDPFRMQVVPAESRRVQRNGLRGGP